MLKLHSIIFIFLLCCNQNFKVTGAQASSTSSSSSGSALVAQSASQKAALELKYKIKRKQLDVTAIKKIEGSIGYQFKDKKLLVQALTTRAKNPKKNYERYEYFGDTVLEMIVTKMLLQEYPDASEGALTAAGSSLVRQEALAALCLRLGLHVYIQDAHSTVPISTLCDIIESLTGAIYEDGGEKAAQDFTVKFFLPMIQGKQCPQQMAKIILAAAKDAKEDVKYTRVQNKCVLIKSPGTGIVKPLAKKKVAKGSKKADPQRLACYLAEKEFITREVDRKYQQHLVRLAIDRDYNPLERLPALSLSWSVGNKANFRVYLHTLMQMLGCKAPVYAIQEDDETPAHRFVCTLAHHPFKPVVSSAPTKNEAEEAVAEKAYKQIQKTVLLAENFASDLKAIAALDPNDPVASLNVLCGKLGLTFPAYTSYFREKNNAVVFYTCFTAPWLMMEIRGESSATANASKVAVARNVVSLIRHFIASCIEPKRLQLLCVLGDTQDPVSVLHRLCQTCFLEQPKMETHICEGAVTEGLCFQTTITIADKHWGSKILVGEKNHSKTEAEKSAALKTLNYLANKMFKEEITPVRA